jgi:hypothetical protein
MRAAMDGFGGRAHWTWNHVARAVGSRSAKQCRERWTNHLDPALTKCPWDGTEDSRLREMAQSGVRKFLIAHRMGRSQTAVWDRLAVLHRNGAAEAADVAAAFSQRGEDGKHRLLPDLFELGPDLPCLFELDPDLPCLFELDPGTPSLRH